MAAERTATLDPTPLGYRQVEAAPNILDIRTFLLLVTLMGVIGLAVWLSLAKLDSATSAPGELRVESHRKTLKVLEPGMVHRLMVSEGDHVTAGQPLIELDPTRVNAAAQILRQRADAAQAQLARFEAEATGHTSIKFPDSLLQRAHEPDVRAAMLTEADLFDTRMSSLQARREVTKSRIDQLQTRVQSNDNQIAATREQIALITDELQSVEFLLQKNLIQKSRYLAVKRTHVDLKAKLSDLQSQRAQLESEIGATRLELLDLDETARKEALAGISERQAELLELDQQMNSARSTVGLYTLRAPISGTVVNLEVYSEGIVVLGGEELMQIVPDNDELIVETKIAPDDIDNVAVGMPAKVRLTALNARFTPLLAGTVTLVSADLASPKTGDKKYYLATVTLLEEEVEKLNGTELSPGMQANVMIVKGERTVLDYVLSPLTQWAETAMREP